jgi:hypothetical protein
MVPCKEQARNRGPSPVVVFCSRRLVLYATQAPSSRPSVARVGTHEHRPVIMGPRLRGDDRREALCSFGQNRRWVRLAKMRGARERPHVSVGIFIVNNNPQATDHCRPHVQVGSSRGVRRVASFGQNAQRSPALMLRSIAARPSAGPSDRRGALRCVSKHEGVCKGPSSSFETRARKFEFAESFSHARSSG